MSAVSFMHKPLNAIRTPVVVNGDGYLCTDWLPGNLEPEYIGVYQRNYELDRRQPANPVYCYWDGQFWYAWGDTPEEAVQNYDDRCVSFWQKDPWRGCTTKQGPIQYSRAGVGG